MSRVIKSKYIIVCIGTPITTQLNPSLKAFISFFYQLKKLKIRKNKILIDIWGLIDKK